MTSEVWLFALLGLLPVVVFLFVLVFLDSYKLVRLSTIFGIILLGTLTAVAAWFLNTCFIEWSGVTFQNYTRYVAPLIEELLKALVIVFLFRTSRIGFLVDSAILGFAVGAGFALFENAFYLSTSEELNIGVWLVRGFGTAIMHGGVTAIFAVLSQALTERSLKINPVYYLPGLMVATLLHSVFNHFPVAPILQAFGTFLILPPLFIFIFERSAGHLHEWLELDFDADTRLIGMINSNQFPDSKAGQFLRDLTHKFEGPVVADMLCYLRIYTELAIRAKGTLMMRENGFDAPVGERTREKFAELRYLEKSIGKTGCLAMRPFLQMERKDLWQLKVLSKAV